MTGARNRHVMMGSDTDCSGQLQQEEVVGGINDDCKIQNGGVFREEGWEMVLKEL